ncbi:hypothetical protein RM553_12475 [Zunongwangia sp. F363]|uniref:Secreted protein n=1 Tax=Autumnicola tepida TaxID=3075595 RepID=A0ABU3CBE4_9FLAO|nr:hypothetical protein [Zunongwangia sp. F363]MDT0643650.1 hypothetical protein [Zunongwangia sp. F363]
MKKALQNSISVVMALLVMFSTLSFTVDKHFCGSVLVDSAVLSKAKTCGMEMSSSKDEMKDSCCSNEKVAVHGQDELKNSFQTFDLNQQLFFTAFTFSYLNLFESLPKQVVPFKDYIPPLLVKDIPVFHETFLI